ncbi:MAG: cell division protein ZapA [Trichloromonadaceae bacterium]
MKQAVSVTILGQHISLKSEAPPEEVREVAAFVNAKVAEVMAGGRTVDTQNAAILALLNVAGLYLRLREQTKGGSRDDQDGDVRLRQLLQRLEQACPAQHPPD